MWTFRANLGGSGSLLLDFQGVGLRGMFRDLEGARVFWPLRDPSPVVFDIFYYKMETTNPFLFSFYVEMIETENNCLYLFWLLTCFFLQSEAPLAPY